ncbi:ABC transporter ATP-binding protein [Paenibacillus sp. P26]|nr:ABC transporter ATP-binding protein [Paenibacillus sp. P26]
MSEQRHTQPPRPPGGFRGPGGGGPMIGMPVQKAKNFKGSFRRLLGYLKPFKWRLTAVVATALLSTVFGIVSPKIMGQATTELFKGFMTKQNGVAGTGIDFGYIGQIVLILIGLYLLSALFSYIQQYLMAGVAQNTVYALRKDVNDKLARLPLKFFDSRPHGEILSRVVNDVDSISTTLQQSLTQPLTSVITLLGIIVMMLTISPSLTLILVLTPPLSFLAIKAISSRSLTYFKGQQKALGELNGHVEEMYTGHKIVKAFGHETKSVAKFDGINEELYQAGWKAQFISGVMMPLMSFINNLGYVGICVVGGCSSPGDRSKSAISRRSSSMPGSFPCRLCRPRKSRTLSNRPSPPPSGCSSCWTKRRSDRIPRRISSLLRPKAA